MRPTYCWNIAKGFFDKGLVFSNVVIFGSILDPVIQFEHESPPKINTPLKVLHTHPQVYLDGVVLRINYTMQGS